VRHLLLYLYVVDVVKFVVAVLQRRNARSASDDLFRDRTCEAIFSNEFHRLKWALTRPMELNLEYQRVKVAWSYAVPRRDNLCHGLKWHCSLQ
jgi:hypothetical protein